MAGSYLIRVKAMPSGPEVPADQLLSAIKGVLEKDMVLKSSKEDPIAFGLYALIVDIVTPEAEGMPDRVEAAVAKAPMVTQSEVVGVSRMSSQLRI
ncbi:MAG: elongation factor 1-beta [Nitrososphaerota archaeon]|nr:elongation factor 1-beta [Nitrososphaerota archaeon]MDG6966989.1 elongation factor 1-beta [Nitrososphaerota archaeon]MDG6979000.1 elongation factor 1-beta [Nitrososphaerota archaeon]MDG7006582.1 elongation factor 1-beta [Nitrososphaerota archaeon]MDG7020944.1 elongation factor 1-beta [Nitrososphaerota archaeon]